VIGLVQHVRRAAVSALSTAAHNKPGLVKDLLPTLLPLLYDQTVVKVHTGSTFQQF
jgi:cullin-associated NEDD8-dissociated protein 1